MDVGSFIWGFLTCTGCVLMVLPKVVNNHRKADRDIIRHLSNDVVILKDKIKYLTTKRQVPEPIIPETTEQDNWEKLKKINDLAREIDELSAHIEMPSKNQLHSIFKNDLIRKAKGLIEQRDNLLLEIWNSGFNPSIPVEQEDGSMVRMNLRDALADKFNSIEKKEPKKSHLRLVKDNENEDS